MLTNAEDSWQGWREFELSFSLSSTCVLLSNGNLIKIPMKVNERRLTETRELPRVAWEFEDYFRQFLIYSWAST